MHTYNCVRMPSPAPEFCLAVAQREGASDACATE
jgi:hypothetical protein